MTRSHTKRHSVHLWPGSLNRSSFSLPSIHIIHRLPWRANPRASFCAEHLEHGDGCGGSGSHAASGSPLLGALRLLSLFLLGPRLCGDAQVHKARLPPCSGLRVCAARPAPSASFPTRRASSHRGIVAEVQETVTGAGVVSDKTFKKLVLESDIPVLVDFWAPWCGPCRMIAPLIDELARTYAGRLKCLKLNTDESPGVATEYGIRSIPTVMIFKDGVKKDTVIGAVPKTTLTATIDKYLDWK